MLGRRNLYLYQRSSRSYSEALLIDSDCHALPANQLLDHPALFPFVHQLTLADLREVDAVEVHRQGIDGDVIELQGIKRA